MRRKKNNRNSETKRAFWTGSTHIWSRGAGRGNRGENIAAKKKQQLSPDGGQAKAILPDKFGVAYVSQYFSISVFVKLNENINK